MTINSPHRRGVAITMNLRPTVDAMAKHFLRLIEQANPLFLNGGKLAKTIQKRWYSKALLNPDGDQCGFVHFTIINRDILDTEFSLSDNGQHVINLEYLFVVKQNEINGTFRNFTSGTLRYKTSWNGFSNENLEFQLYGGTDIEHGVILRNFIAEMEGQLTNFNISDETLIAQNELSLIPLKTHGGAL